MSLDQTVSDAWASADPDDPYATVTFFRDLLAQDPTDPARQFELANAYDGVGREAEAVPHYESAIRGGVAGDRARRARVQLGSSLRNLGRADEAVRVLDEAVRRYPDSPSAECFLALSLADAGRPREAVARLVDLVARSATDDDTVVYKAALRRYARLL